MTDLPSSLDVHQLLGEHDFVRRLARSLVFDQDRIDDVVQEAWLAAMQRPPRERAAVGSWFRAVLHNLARRRARDELRRRTREAAAARPEALPSAADVLARENQRREVVEAVLELPEPYRGTVLARFFDELEPAEIARRRGVPAATVRSHLHRALQLLRERFERRHGGARAWGLWLLPLARPLRQGTTGLSTAAGALLMAKVLAGAGVLALAVLGWLFFGADATVPAPADAGGSAVAAAPSSTAAAGKPTPPGADAQRIAVAGIEQTTTPRAHLGGLRGRVLRPDGSPAADCLVRVLGIDGVALFLDAPTGGEPRTLPLPHGQTRTAADGTFTIAGLQPATRYAVTADADGEDRTLRLASATPMPDQVADLGDFVLEAKACIAGRAVDDDGEPVAGAEVLALDLPAPLLAALPIDRFAPEHGGMLALPAPEADEAPAAYHERLHGYLARELFTSSDLDRRDGLQTLVVDRLPWLEALWRELPIARATSGADGAFVLQAVEPGSNLLLLRKPGLATGSLPRVVVQVGERREVGDVTLPAGEELRGVVRDADGEPVVGAEVRVGSIGALGYRGVAFAGAPVHTGQGGSFAVPGLGRGRAIVAARRSAAEPWLAIGPVATDDDVELQLPAASPLRLQLSRSDGAPLRGVAIELFTGPDLRELRRAGLQQRLPVAAPGAADADGVFTLPPLSPGSYTLCVTADGVLPATAIAVLPQPAPLAVALQPTQPLRVHVRDAAGAAVAGARVYVDGAQASSEAVLPTDYGLPRWNRLPHFAGTTDANGDLRTDGVAGAEVRVLHPLQAPSWATIEAGASELTVTMTRPGAIAGRLFDGGVPADPRRFCVVVEPKMWSVPLPDLRAALQPDGSFALPIVAPTTYRLHAEPRGAALSLGQLLERAQGLVMPLFLGTPQPVQHDLRVEAGATATLEFDVDPNQPQPGVLPARLHGRALLDGAPLAGAELQRLVGEWMHYSTVATVAADGSFAAPTLPPGTQQLRLQQPTGDTAWEGDVELRAGEDFLLDLAMATGSVRGSAAFPSGLPVAGHVVTANGTCHGGSVRRWATIDATGQFAFAALPAGRYTLQASGRDGRSDEQVVEIAAGQAAPPVRFELREVTVLSGRIAGDLDGRDVMIVLTLPGGWRGNGLEAGNTFHFSDLEPQTYRLHLQVDGKDVALEPGTFDMRQGSQRGLVLRMQPAQAK